LESHEGSVDGIGTIRWHSEVRFGLLRSPTSDSVGVGGV